MQRVRTSRGSIGVIHIAHAAYGLEPFRAFIDSYRLLKAGVPHNLLIVLKGFMSRTAIKPFVDLLDGLEADIIEQCDGGYDIGSYFDVIRTTEYELYCCFNSRSRILVDDWLLKLCMALELESVGLAGATASLESLFTDHVENRRRAIEPKQSGLRAMLQRSVINDLRHWLRYRPFPNAHLRTNAFIMRREIALMIDPGRIQRRRQTAAFENGRGNVTRRLMRMGLRSVVVGRDGRCFDQQVWSESGTFWQGRQENLLVADNQTALYDHADRATQAALSERAWGSFAKPVEDK